MSQIVPPARARSKGHQGEGCDDPGAEGSVQAGGRRRGSAPLARGPRRARGRPDRCASPGRRRVAGQASWQLGAGACSGGGATPRGGEGTGRRAGGLRGGSGVPVHDRPGPARPAPPGRAHGQPARRGLPSHRTGRGRGRGVRHLRRARLLDHPEPKYGFTFYVLPEIAQARDLVYVDQRGVGLSDPIDCPGLQAGPVSLYEDTAACHDQLGDASDLYSTTDVADDLEDVRRALGYGRIDLFGGSYAGADMLTYAVRHTKRVRSVVLSSPAVVVGTDPFYAYAPEAMTGIAAKCAAARRPAEPPTRTRPPRSPRLARDLRRQPVRGTGVDSCGATHEVKVTENLLANGIMYFNGAHFTGPGEIIPAMAAARGGDTVPLLRLGADTDPRTASAPRCASSPTATACCAACVDGELPFDKTRRAATARGAVRRAHTPASPLLRPSPSRRGRHPGYLGFQPSPCIVGAGRTGRCTAGHPVNGRADAGARRRVRPARPRGRGQARDARHDRRDVRGLQRGRPRSPVLVGLRPRARPALLSRPRGRRHLCAGPAGRRLVGPRRSRRRGRRRRPSRRAVRLRPAPAPARHRRGLDGDGQRAAQLLRPRRRVALRGGRSTSRRSKAERSGRSTTPASRRTSVSTARGRLPGRGASTASSPSAAPGRRRPR